MRTELGVGNACVGIFVARLDPLKGLEALIRGLAQLRDESAPVMVLIAGDGPERDTVERLACELKLGADRLRLLGFRNDVPDLLGAADFYVLPSLTEGLPLSLLEAMAHRLPVVATPVGGIPEVVRDGEDGLLVPTNDPRALARAMARLAGDAALRVTLGEAAFRRVTVQFSFEQMVREYEVLYHACAARSGRRAPGEGA
jgi:glycosyltransferase involved in cell wall biosynthesis